MAAVNGARRLNAGGVPLALDARVAIESSVRSLPAHVLAYEMRFGVHEMVGWAPAGRRGVSARWSITAIVAVVVVCRVLDAAPAVAASEYFTVVGAGAADVKLGVVAARTSLEDQPIEVAAGRDGSFAFSVAGQLNVVRNGRIALVDRKLSPFDMEYASDGSLIGVALGGVWRIDAQGTRTRIAGRDGADQHGGDGGPAHSATFECATAIDVDNAGGILVADRCARRVRRIGPDGFIQTVAGNGEPGGGGDGGPATAASLNSPSDVVALPGGGFALLDGQPQAAPSERIRVVDPAGTITTRSRVPATELAAEPDGGILMVDSTIRSGKRGPLVSRLRPDGTVEKVLDRSQRAGVDFYVGECVFYPSCELQIDSISRAADGSLLLGGGDGAFYVPSSAPEILSVALGSRTRVPRPALSVAVRLTRAARVRIRVSSRLERPLAKRTIDLPAGESEIEFPHLNRPALYDVKLDARAGAQRAFAWGVALAGGLTNGFVRELVLSPGSPFPRGQSTVPCRRRGAWRQVCHVNRKPPCFAVVTVRVLKNGTPSKKWRGRGRLPRCKRSHR
jgi:hypothetical protein